MTGARLVECAAPDGRLSAAAALQALGGAGLTRVLCEGGGRIAASLLHDGLADRLVAFVAGKVIGADGRAAVGPLALPDLAAAPRFRLTGLRPVGEDAVLEWDRVADL